ncbi:MAG: nucleoside hydrolase [Anderseniella sp.]
MQKIIIDTDPGIDDAMAVLFACLSPDIELVGLTSIFGNVPTDIATRNAKVLVEMARHDVPVARGVDAPVQQPARPVAWEVHGREGFGDVAPVTPTGQPVDETAAEFICRTVSEHPGEIVLCPVGPLTNLARALELDPAIADKVKSVTVMGGSLNAGGNVTPSSEANIWQDPHAADIVFAAGWDVTMVGLDVTHQVKCTPQDFANLVKPAPVLGGFLNDAVQHYFEFHRQVDGFDGCYMHDPSAVVSIVRPDLFAVEREPLRVIVEGAETGRTVRAASSERPATSVCTGVEASAVRNLFLETVSSGF